MKRCAACDQVAGDDLSVCTKCGGVGFHPGPPPARRGTFSFNGFGTTLYGKRGFKKDGSYFTTEFIAAAYLPLFPLRTIRIRPTTPGWNFIHAQFLILEQMPLSLPQVLSVMLFAYVFLGLLLAVNFLPDDGTEQRICAWAAMLVLPIPWVLRRLARQNATE